MLKHDDKDEVEQISDKELENIYDQHDKDSPPKNRITNCPPTERYSSPEPNQPIQSTTTKQNKIPEGYDDPSISFYDPDER